MIVFLFSTLVLALPASKADLHSCSGVISSESSVRTSSLSFSSSSPFVTLYWKYELLMMFLMFSFLVLPSPASETGFLSWSLCNVEQGLWTECLDCCNKGSCGLLLSTNVSSFPCSPNYLWAYKLWSVYDWIFTSIWEKVYLPWLGDSHLSGDFVPSLLLT